jgi:hypothetical protein
MLRDKVSRVVGIVLVSAFQSRTGKRETKRRSV